ncbi:MAG TPA: serine hydrolase [Vicinamibacteria bacterium]|nr:serine hydrolase [Vicinamibacteria bacterium]
MSRPRATLRIPHAITGLLVTVLLTEGASGSSPGWPAGRWPVASPAAVGMDARVLAALDADIGSGKHGNVDSMLVIRCGQVVYDRAYPRDYDRIFGEMARKPSPLNAGDPSGPYNYFNSWWHPFLRRGDLHTLQSVTKTVTSIVIGVATARKEFPSLDTPVLQFFDASKVAAVDDRKRRITIRHLLTMTAGLEWDEDLPYVDPRNSGCLMEASHDWIKYALDRPMSAEPGTLFRYNSGASELLAHVFRVATGADVEEYAQRHLFAPLGIDRWYWKRTPTGAVDTEGGLYLDAHDLARLWYLFLRGGRWGNEVVVQQEWVDASVAPGVEVGRGVKYGFQWWLLPYRGGGSRRAWAGLGFGDQIPVVVPELDLVVVFTGWNILPDRAGLPWAVAVDRVVRSVTTRAGACGAR